MGAALIFSQANRPGFPVTQYCIRFQHIADCFAKQISRNKTVPGLVTIIAKYDVLLQRYARFMIKDQVVAANLVKEIFERVYDENGFGKTAAALRLQFKNYTLKACKHWMRMQELQRAQNN